MPSWLSFEIVILEEDAATVAAQKQNTNAANKNGANSPDKKQTVKLVKSVIYLSHEWARWSSSRDRRLDLK